MLPWGWTSEAGASAGVKRARESSSAAGTMIGRLARVAMEVDVEALACQFWARAGRRHWSALPTSRTVLPPRTSWYVFHMQECRSCLC